MPRDSYDTDTVPCPRCGCSVWSHAEQCPRCGEWFAGEAWEAVKVGPARLWRWVAFVLLIAIFLLILAGAW